MGLNDTAEQLEVAQQECVRLERELGCLKATTRSLGKVLLHWRDRAAGYSNAPSIPAALGHSAPAALDHAADLVRRLADGQLDEVELDRLAHFGEDGECTALNYRGHLAEQPSVDAEAAVRSQGSIAPCGCDLSGMGLPARHILDNHEGDQS